MQPLLSFPGASGPVALDAAGALYYATSSASFPAPPGATRILRYRRVAGAPERADLAAEEVASGFDGALDLAWDPTTGALYLSESSFGVANRIRRVGTGPADSPIVVEGDPFQSIANLEILPGEAPAVLAPFQPATGGRLLYNNTDFFSVFERHAVAPARPLVGLVGPGTRGVGAVDYALSGGPPNGTFVVLYGPSSTYQSNEPAYALGADVPLFLGLALGTLTVVPGSFALDANGAGSAAFQNATGQTGFLATQALVFDAEGVLVGSSDAAFL
jgi:hypothetical protein